MDFVRNDPQPVLAHDGGNLFQLLLRPHAARRVVWVAEDQHFYRRILGLGGQIGKINFKACSVSLSGEQTSSTLL